jgi:hypothetical protein
MKCSCDATRSVWVLPIHLRANSAGVIPTPMTASRPRSPTAPLPRDRRSLPGPYRENSRTDFEEIPLTPEVPLRANRLISALQTSSYCLVTPGATCSPGEHQVAPATRSCPAALWASPPLYADGRALAATPAGMPARLGDCTPGRPGLAAGRRRRGAVTARSPPHPMWWGRPGAARGLVLARSRLPTTQIPPTQTEDLGTTAAATAEVTA